MTMSLATGGVTDALNKAKTGVSSFATTALDKLGTVAKYASGALVAGFVAAAKGAVDYAKELETLAKISNTTTDNFQYFAAGAKTVGIEQEKLADIFKDVNDKIGDFLQAGSGPMVDFFENIAPAIGVTADQFKNLSGPQALQLYYDSLEQANLSQQEMTFYMEAIASDATNLIPMLKNGGAGFKEFGDAARESGLIMDEVTIKSLKEASLAMDAFGVKAKIAAGDTLAGFMLLFEGLKSASFTDGLLSIGKIALGISSSNMDLIREGADGVKGYFDEIDYAASQAYDKMYGYAEGYESSVSSLMNSLTTDLIGNIVTTTEADRKAAAAREATASKLATTLEKIEAERMKQLGLHNETEEQLQILIEKRIDLEKEYLTFVSNIDPFSDANMQADAEKLLAIEKLKTDELKLQNKLDKEAEEARKLAIEATTKELQLELELALASGDPNKIAVARQELDINNQKVALMEQFNIGSKEALAIINAQLAQQQKMIDMERALLEANLAGNDLAARAAQKKIDLEQKALDIMDQFKVSYIEAMVLAEEWMTMMAGADLNNSGFITQFEQREFDRMEAERQQVLDDALAAEEREQREQGGNIRNVSEEKRETGTVSERAAAAREQRLRDAENDRLNRIRDPLERERELRKIEEDRRQRAEDEAIKKLDDPAERQRLQDEADERRALEEKLEAERRRREDMVKDDRRDVDGNLVDDQGRKIDKQGNLVDDNGDPLPDPNAPKQPEPAELEDVLTKMDEMHKNLKSIDKSLKCEP